MTTIYARFQQNFNALLLYKLYGCPCIFLASFKINPTTKNCTSMTIGIRSTTRLYQHKARRRAIVLYVVRLKNKSHPRALGQATHLFRWQASLQHGYRVDAGRPEVVEVLQIVHTSVAKAFRQSVIFGYLQHRK